MDINLTLSSWRNENEPETRSFAFEQTKIWNPRSYRVYNNSQLYWLFDVHNFDMMFHFVFDLLENTTSHLSYNKYVNRTIEEQRFNYDRSRLVMNSSGEIQFWSWWEDNLQWNKLWWRPSDICDRHNYCGNQYSQGRVPDRRVARPYVLRPANRVSFSLRFVFLSRRGQGRVLEEGTLMAAGSFYFSGLKGKKLGFWTGSGYFITRFWFNPYIGKRISEMLNEP
jgi:hypothetical protein